MWLAKGRRRLELRAIAIGVLVVGLLMLAVRRFAGDYFVDKLVKDDAVKPAGHEAWRVLTQTLADRAWVWIILGIVTLVGVWFVGEKRSRRSPHAPLAPPRHEKASDDLPHRRRSTPCTRPGRSPQIARGWLSALVLIGFIVVGIEVVRNIVHREVQQTPTEGDSLV